MSVTSNFGLVACQIFLDEGERGGRIGRMRFSPGAVEEIQRGDVAGILPDHLGQAGGIACLLIRILLLCRVCREGRRKGDEHQHQHDAQL